MRRKGLSRQQIHYLSRDPRFLFRLVLLIVGISWLLVVLNMVPDLQWIWTVGLFLAGTLVMVFLGLDKLTFTIGMFLIVGGVFSILRFQDMISLEIELPVLVICFGSLMALSEMLPLRPPQMGKRTKE